MNNCFNEAMTVMKELYGKDTAMSLATVDGAKQNIRVEESIFAFYDKCVDV